MPTFTFTYDSAEVPALLEGFRVAGRYQETVRNPDFPSVEGAEPTIPNPVSLAQFAKQQVRQYFKNIHEIGVMSLVDVNAVKEAAKADADARSAGFDVA